MEKTGSNFTDRMSGLTDRILDAIWDSIKRFWQHLEHGRTTTVLPKVEDDRGQHCGAEMIKTYVYKPGTLPPWVLEEVMKHIDKCEDCAWEVYGLRVHGNTQ